MIRLRVVSHRRFRRRVYEVEFPLTAGGGVTRRKVTKQPIFDLEEHVGTGDAWAIIDAADDAWDGTTGGWVSLHG